MYTLLEEYELELAGKAFKRSDNGDLYNFTQREKLPNGKWYNIILTPKITIVQGSESGRELYSIFKRDSKLIFSCRGRDYEIIEWNLQGDNSFTIKPLDGYRHISFHRIP